MPEGTIAERVGTEAVPERDGNGCYFICPATGVRCEVLFDVGGRVASPPTRRSAKLPGAKRGRPVAGSAQSAEARSQLPIELSADHAFVTMMPLQQLGPLPG